MPGPHRPAGNLEDACPLVEVEGLPASCGWPIPADGLSLPLHRQRWPSRTKNRKKTGSLTAAASLRQACTAMRSQLNVYRVVRVAIDIFDRMRALGAHPAGARAGRRGALRRGEGPRVALGSSGFAPGPSTIMTLGSRLRNSDSNQYWIFVRDSWHHLPAVSRAVDNVVFRSPTTDPAGSSYPAWRSRSLTARPSSSGLEPSEASTAASPALSASSSDSSA
jgi:hypothetical protein